MIECVQTVWERCALPAGVLVLMPTHRFINCNIRKDNKNSIIKAIKHKYKKTRHENVL